jgi:hypothetical protein
MAWTSALTTQQIVGLHNAIVRAALKVPYSKIKGFLTYATHHMHNEIMDDQEFLILVKGFAEVCETQYPLYEEHNTVFSSLSEEDLAQLRYTLHRIPITVSAEMIPKLREVQVVAGSCRSVSGHDLAKDQEVQSRRPGPVSVWAEAHRRHNHRVWSRAQH